MRIGSRLCLGLMALVSMTACPTTEAMNPKPNPVKGLSLEELVAQVHETVRAVRDTIGLPQNLRVMLNLTGTRGVTNQGKASVVFVNYEQEVSEGQTVQLNIVLEPILQKRTRERNADLISESLKTVIASAVRELNESNLQTLRLSKLSAGISFGISSENKIEAGFTLWKLGASGSTAVRRGSVQEIVIEFSRK